MAKKGQVAGGVSPNLPPKNTTQVCLVEPVLRDDMQTLKTTNKRLLIGEEKVHEEKERKEHKNERPLSADVAHGEGSKVHRGGNSKGIIQQERGGEKQTF